MQWEAGGSSREVHDETGCLSPTGGENAYFDGTKTQHFGGSRI